LRVYPGYRIDLDPKPVRIGGKFRIPDERGAQCRDTALGTPGGTK
jgi:hypothetical protein